MSLPDTIEAHAECPLCGGLVGVRLRLSWSQPTRRTALATVEHVDRDDHVCEEDDGGDAWADIVPLPVVRDERPGVRS